MSNKEKKQRNNTKESKEIKIARDFAIFIYYRKNYKSLKHYLLIKKKTCMSNILMFVEWMLR